jgi:hypothetical protein
LADNFFFFTADQTVWRKAKRSQIMLLEFLQPKPISFVALYRENSSGKWKSWIELI